jgi:hypothetical protein
MSKETQRILPTSGGSSSRSSYGFEERKAYAARHSRGGGWLTNSKDGRYDETIADDLASRAPEAVNHASTRQGACTAEGREASMTTTAQKWRELSERRKRSMTPAERLSQSAYEKAVRGEDLSADELEALRPFAESAMRSFAEYLGALPEEEREELRELARDAPLEPVDVNAPGVM